MAALPAFLGLGTEDLKASVTAAICSACCLAGGGGTLIA